MQVTKYPSVMIADDSADTRDLLRYWLEAQQCRVVEARNGEEAVELMRGDRPDLILMDMLMPLLDGMDAMRRIRADTRGGEIPIIAMSSHPTEEARVNAFAAGCDSFIAHPLDLDQLSDLISRLPSPASPRQLPAVGQGESYLSRRMRATASAGLY